VCWANAPPSYRESDIRILSLREYRESKPGFDKHVLSSVEGLNVRGGWFVSTEFFRSP